MNGSESASPDPDRSSLPTSQPIIREATADEDPSRRCEECGEPFIPKSKRNRFCSDPCKKRNWDRNHKEEKKARKRKRAAEQPLLGVSPEISPADKEAEIPGPIAAVLPSLGADPGQPLEIINEIRHLRSKDFSELEIARRVKLKYLGRYSPNDIAQAYRTQDEERAELDQDERLNEDEALARTRLANVEEVAKETREETADDSGQAEEDRQESYHAFCRDFERTDLGNSERFVRRHRKNARYCHAFKQWYIWDGTRWKPDCSGKVLELAKRATHHIAREAEIANGNTAQQDLYKWAAASQGRARIEAMITLAQSALPVTPEEMDSNPNVLNFTNGTLDLINYKFRAHEREDLCTKVTGAVYNPNADCPKWKDFLYKVLGGKEDLIGFLQRTAGYSLTAETGERAIFLCYGAGANGKSTFLNTVGAGLGDYAMQTESSTFNISKNEQVRNDLARLKGARYVTAIEAGKGKRLDESLVEQLSGGDRIAARFLFKEYFEFKPEFKIWWAFNHKPVINDTTQSIWDRVKLIPFTITIPPEERDRDLSTKLLKELPGILNWCIEGLKEYRRIGLAEPAEVTAATNEYREEQDRLGDFFGERCSFDPSGFVSALDLYYEYTKWCTDNREEPVSKRIFGLEMNDRPVIREKNPKTKQRGYRGISLAGSVYFKVG